MTKLTTIPSLKSGSDAEAGKFLAQKFSEAQHGKRLIVACGLAAWEFKSQLNHGQWGPWLAAHAPSLARIDSKTGKPKASNALSSTMDMTAGILKSLGFTVEKYFKHISNSLNKGIYHRGEFLLLPDAKVPDEAKPLREKICDLVDGKTKYQLCLEFKQVEETETGTLKKKRGRLKGQGGASKDQRLTAAEVKEKARVLNIQLEAKEFAGWILKHCGPEGVAKIEPEAFAEFFEAYETGWDFLSKYHAAQKKGAK